MLQKLKSTFGTEMSDFKLYNAWHKSFCPDIFYQVVGFYKNNNSSRPHSLWVNSPWGRRLRSAGDNDWRSKRFCSSAVLCVSFTLQMVKKRVIRLRVIEVISVPSVLSIHSYLKSKRMLAKYMRRIRNNNLEIGLRAKRGARNKAYGI